MSSAQSLLFGPRQPQILSKAGQEARALAARRFEQKREGDEFKQRAEAAREAIFSGDGLPLATLLAEPKNDDLSCLEDDFTEQLIGDLYRHTAQAERGAEPLNDERSLSGLILLADKCRGCESLDEESLIVCHRYGAAMANRRLQSRLSQEAEQIGPLPAASYDYHYKAHIPVGPAEAAVCGATLRGGYTTFNYQLASFVHSAATALIECDRCLEFYRRNPSKGATINPAEWISMFNNLKYSCWGDCFDLGFGGILEGSNIEDRGYRLIDYYYQKARENCEGMLAAVDKHRP